jgi:hypothetical protein
MGRILSGIFKKIAFVCLLFVFVLLCMVGLDYLNGLYDDLADLETGIKKLEDQITATESFKTNMGREIAQLNQNIQTQKNEINKLKNAFPWASRFPFTEIHGTISAIEKTLEELKTERQKKHPEMSAIAERLENNKSELSRLKDLKDQNLLYRALTILSEQLGAAGNVVIGILVIPPVFKILFYFVIAPRAEKRKAIRIIPAHEETGLNEIFDEGRGKSSKSLNIRLCGDEEILVKPEYLQSSSPEAQKSTQLFLNRSMPLSSIASGMYNLTRITSTDNEPIVLKRWRSSVIPEPWQVLSKRKPRQSK